MAQHILSMKFHFILFTLSIFWNILHYSSILNDCISPSLQSQLQVLNESFIAYDQKLRHCGEMSTKDVECAKYYLKIQKKYIWYVRDHYDSLSSMYNHSVHVRKHISIYFQAWRRFLFNTSSVLDCDRVKCDDKD